MSDFPLTYKEFLEYPGRKEPYYFGLGFIKVRLDDEKSMNFYDPELGVLVGDEEVHDHRYGFTSKIIKGELVNEVFDVHWVAEDEEHSHTIVDAVCVEGGAEQVVGYANIGYFSVTVMVEGSQYTMAHNCFHRVFPGPKGAITALKRGPIIKETALIIKPVNSPPMCPYSKKIPLEELYSRIEKLYSM